VNRLPRKKKGKERIDTLQLDSREKKGRKRKTSMIVHCHHDVQPQSKKGAAQTRRRREGVEKNSYASTFSACDCDRKKGGRRKNDHTFVIRR